METTNESTPGLDEEVITPEMIKAVAAILYRFDGDSEEYWAAEILREIGRLKAANCSRADAC